MLAKLVLFAVLWITLQILGIREIAMHLIVNKNKTHNYWVLKQKTKTKK